MRTGIEKHCSMFCHSDLQEVLTNSCPLSFCLPRPVVPTPWFPCTNLYLTLRSLDIPASHKSTPACPPNLQLGYLSDTASTLSSTTDTNSRKSKDYLLLPWIIHVTSRSRRTVLTISSLLQNPPVPGNLHH